MPARSLGLHDERNRRSGFVLQNFNEESPDSDDFVVSLSRHEQVPHPPVLLEHKGPFRPSSDSIFESDAAQFGSAH